MSYLAINDLAESDAFKTRLKVALVAVARDVLTESVGTQTPSERQKRRDLAMTVILNPNNYVNSFIWAAVSNTTVSTKGMDSTDNEVKTAVTQAWPYVAGINAEDLTPSP